MYILKKICHNIIKAIENTIKHDGVEHAGYLSFLSLLCVFPFIIFIINFFNIIGKNIINSPEIIAFINEILLKLEVNKNLHDILTRAKQIISEPDKYSFLTAVISSIWTSSAAVEGIRTALNKAYRVTNPPKYIFRRLLSIGQFFLITILMLLSFLLKIAIPILVSVINNKYINIIFNDFWYLFNDVIFILILFFSVIGLYYLVPNTKIKLSQIWPGAVLVIILWYILAKILMIYFLYTEYPNLVYGSLTGIIFFLLFFYIINIIFIFGAEFNYLFYNKK